jgi:tetratricopeptide (TPR) repeat protein/radical SAM superfamily enzyme YgiQ (UPF0313 family)
METNKSSQPTSNNQSQMTVDDAIKNAIDHFNAERYIEADKLCTAIIQAVPNHIDAINLLGVVAQKVNRHDLAIEQFQKAINIDNARALLYYNLGTSLYPLGRKDEAVKVLKIALGMEPGNSQISSYLNGILNDLISKPEISGPQNKEKDVLQQGISFHQSGRLYEAISCYRKALEINPGNATVLSNMGVALQTIGRLEEAVTSYQKAISIKPDYADAYYNLGNTLEEQGKLEEAVTSYQKAISIKPDYADACYNLGNTLKDQGKLEEAVTSHQKAIFIKPDYADAYYNLGIALKEQGKLEEAVASYQKAIFIKPDYAEAYSNLGIALKEQGKLEGAVTSYQKAISIKPDYADAYYNLGNTLQEQGKLEGAVTSYQKAISIKPDYAGAYYNLGNTLKEQGKLEEAVSSYQKAISIKPDYADAYSNLGIALKEQGKLEEAVTNCQKAIAIKPDYAEAYSNLGNTLKEQGQLEKAVSSYQKAIAIKPDYVDAYSNLGVTLKEQGKTKESYVAHQKAIQSYPGFPAVLANLGVAINRVESSDEVVIPLLVGSQTNLVSTNINYTTAPDSVESIVVGKAEQNKKNVEPTINDKSYNLQATLEEFARKDGVSSSHRDLRIMLIQPPIHKIPAPDEEEFHAEDGGRPVQSTHKITGDSTRASYGLLSIAAQILESGRKVLVCNISISAWRDVEKLIRYIDVDLIGITCMTFNLHGVASLAQLLREVHPNSHIVVGGSHPTALPAETLKHYQEIDTVVVGEGEQPFLEIIERLESNQPVHGIAGTAWRDDNNRVQFGAVSERIQDLDSLASPHDYFLFRILITSRGCPFQCTFCGSESQWGRKVKMNSVENILQSLEQLVNNRGYKYLAIKDDTFTASRKKILALCQSIMEKKLNFIWSCDTRVNSLDEEVLRAMRMAGCQRISLGVESGSPTILKTINKKLVPEKVVEISEIARKFGLQIRFYMIIGNRGETLNTFQESIQLIHDAKPNEFGFHNLSYLPGTEEFEIYKKEKKVTGDIFFADDYYITKYGFHDNVSGPIKKIINLWMNCYDNGRKIRHFSIEESQAILERLDGLHSAHMDLAGAYLRDGQPETMSYMCRVKRFQYCM